MCVCCALQYFANFSICVRRLHSLLCMPAFVNVNVICVCDLLFAFAFEALNAAFVILVVHKNRNISSPARMCECVCADLFACIACARFIASNGLTIEN